MVSVVETAFAKINLDLLVRRRRADGYHDLDSLVVFAEVGDRLRFERSGTLALTIQGPFAGALSDDEDNLVMRAARALADMVGRKADVHVTLDKRLPVASGLGGGSADAAATLRALAKLWNLPLGPADLIPLARTLGADVPVCLRSAAVRMQGIGDRLTPFSQAASPSSLVLVNPGKAVSTRDVFHALPVLSCARERHASDDEDHDVAARLETSVNDLEAPAVNIAPVIGDVLAALRSRPGCVLARMSGSGATCFGLFDNTRDRDRAVSALSQSHPDWWVIGTNVR